MALIEGGDAGNERDAHPPFRRPSLPETDIVPDGEGSGSGHGDQLRYESVTLADRFNDMEMEQHMIFLEVDTSSFNGMVPSMLVPSPPMKEDPPSATRAVLCCLIPCSR